MEIGVLIQTKIMRIQLQTEFYQEMDKMLKEDRKYFELC